MGLIDLFNCIRGTRGSIWHHMYIYYYYDWLAGLRFRRYSSVELGSLVSPSLSLSFFFFFFFSLSRSHLHQEAPTFPSSSSFFIPFFLMIRMRACLVRYIFVFQFFCRNPVGFGCCRKEGRESQGNGISAAAASGTCVAVMV